MWDQEARRLSALGLTTTLLADLRSQTLAAFGHCGVPYSIIGSVKIAVILTWCFCNCGGSTKYFPKIRNHVLCLFHSKSMEEEFSPGTQNRVCTDAISTFFLYIVCSFTF